MKFRTKVEIIAGILFWGGMVWMGIQYGWQLPVSVFLVIFGAIIQMKNKEENW